MRRCGPRQVDVRGFRAAELGVMVVLIAQSRPATNVSSTSTVPGRHTRHLSSLENDRLRNLELLRTLEDRKIGFRSLTEGVDPTTPAGKILATMLSALAQMEREIIIERTHAGLAAARARGRIGGRPRALTAVQVEQAQLMHKRGTGVSEIAATLDMGRSTVYRALEQK